MEDEQNKESPKKKKIKTKEGETNQKENKILEPPTQAIYKTYLRRLRRLGGYDLDNKGNLCSYDRNGESFIVANFIARPMLEVIRDDGVTQVRTYKIEGVLNGGIPLKPIDVTAKEFLGMQWIIEKWGIQASIRAGMGKKDIVRDVIQNMAKGIAVEKIYTHIGWRKINDKYCYLHAGGCIGGPNISVELEPFAERYTLPNKIENQKKAAEASFKLLRLAPQEVTIPLMALVYLSPLVEAFRLAGLEPNFLIWLNGLTGTRKTSLALLFLSHFGSFDGKNPPASFKDTVNAIEKKAFATKDSLLLIDDYHPEINKLEMGKTAQIAQKILRMYGDRIGKGRLKPTIELQKENPPRGMALVTGEDLPTGQSSVARFLALELLQDDIDLKKLTIAQNRSYLLKEAMAGYIEWLLPQMEDLPEKIKNEFQQKRRRFQAYAAHGRLGDAAASLSIAFGLMLDYMLKMGVCNEETVVKLSKLVEQTFSNLIRKQNQLVHQERPAEIFVKVLGELMATGKVRLDPIKSGLKALPSDNNGEKIGWMDEKFLYLLPEAAYNAVSKFLSSRGETLPVKERTLWKHLDEAKLIMVEKGKDGQVQRCPKKTIKQQKHSKNDEPYRPRLLHVYKSAINQEPPVVTKKNRGGDKNEKKQN